MNKTKLVAYVSRKTKMAPKEAKWAVDWTLDGIKYYSKSRTGIKLTGFGNFKCVGDKPKRKWNSRTKKYTYVQGPKTVQFTPNKMYREYVMK
ncbi:MAG: HU family DNA-binding protein [Candidatus Eisenbacteria bacterium]